MTSPNSLLASFRGPFLLLALGLLGRVAVLSALYPARRAAEMEPVDSLRYE